MNSRFSVGADPELFVINRETNAFVSAHDLIPGTKQVPFAVDKGAVQVDGASAEFNINPSKTLEEFSENIFTVYNTLLTMVRSKSPNYDLMAIPTADFDPKYFRSLPATVKALGCTPDYDAYTMAENAIQPPAKTFRTGSGHVHIGWDMSNITDEEHFLRCSEVVRQLDVALYIPSLLWDADDTRRTLYGKIGSFRPKPYGVEYRCLSNAWILQPDLHRFIFQTVQKALELYDQNVLLYDDETYRDAIEDIRAGVHFEHAEILNLYWDLYTGDFVDSLPEAYAPTN